MFTMRLENAIENVIESLIENAIDPANPTSFSEEFRELSSASSRARAFLCVLLYYEVYKALQTLESKELFVQSLRPIRTHRTT